MSAPLLTLPALVADIGGTNARVAIVGADGSLGESIRFPIAGYEDFGAGLRARVLPTLAERPRSAILAVAAIAEGDRVKLTNGPWTIEPRKLMAELGLSTVVLLNDFEALALALPSLPPSSLVPIGGGSILPHAPKLVIGPGTGLGIAALLPVGERWLPVATEGGHMSFGPIGARDVGIWRAAFPESERQSVEKLISGPGIERLYHAVATIAGITPANVNAAGVAALADGGDRIASEALDLFAGYLGRLAGDMALLFLARGGVYVGGGIAPRMVERFRAGAFRTAFVDKAPHRAFVEGIATVLITHPMPALVGMAAFAADPSRYAVDLTGRCW